MHDPMVVVFDVHAPIPMPTWSFRDAPRWGVRRRRFTGPVDDGGGKTIDPWWRPRAWQLFLRGKRVGWWHVATVWHVEPGPRRGQLHPRSAARHVPRGVHPQRGHRPRPRPPHRPGALHAPAPRRADHVRQRRRPRRAQPAPAARWSGGEERAPLPGAGLEQEWWQRHVVEGIEPAVDGSKAATEALALIEARAGTVKVLDPDELGVVEDLFRQLAHDQEVVKEATSGVDLTKNTLRQMLGEATELEDADGTRWATWRQQKDKTATDWQAAARSAALGLGVPLDELAAPHTTTSPGPRVLRVDAGLKHITKEIA